MTPRNRCGHPRLCACAGLDSRCGPRRRLLGFTESIVGTAFGAAASAFLSFGVVILLLVFRPWGILGTPET